MQLNATGAQWFDLTREVNGKEVLVAPDGPPIRLQIRRVADAKLQELRFHHFGRTQEYRVKDGYRQGETDSVKMMAFHVDYGALAWIGTEGAEWGIETEDEAQEWTKTLGKPVRAEEQISLSELNEAGRRLLLTVSEHFRAFVIAKAEALRELGGRPGKG